MSSLPINYSTILSQQLKPLVPSKLNFIVGYDYEEGRDSPANARNVILVVVTLIAAVTIPGGVWQDKDDGHAPGYGVATAAMLVTYTSALYAVTPDDSLNLIYVLIAAALPFVIRCLIHLFNKCIIRFKSKSNMHPDD
ncbi:hypothetical protein Pint_00076 [Pistacia integerrima]|uniref:Uncharacterized protein n=1 Tax=Pistacia integerrima TaxID=434235 RepID=A0ACC0ZKZ7_9ROSI|nr:hypothetical protein Pint_00076 [Pistacia integerrima]